MEPKGGTSTDARAVRGWHRLQARLRGKRVWQLRYRGCARRAAAAAAAAQACACMPPSDRRLQRSHRSPAEPPAAPTQFAPRPTLADDRGTQVQTRRSPRSSHSQLRRPSWEARRICAHRPHAKARVLMTPFSSEPRAAIHQQKGSRMRCTVGLLQARAGKPESRLLPPERLRVVVCEKRPRALWLQCEIAWLWLRQGQATLTAAAETAAAETAAVPRAAVDPAGGASKPQLSPEIAISVRVPSAAQHYTRVRNLDCFLSYPAPSGTGAEQYGNRDKGTNNRDKGTNNRDKGTNNRDKGISGSERHRRGLVRQCARMCSRAELPVTRWKRRVGWRWTEAAWLRSAAGRLLLIVARCGARVTASQRQRQHRRGEDVLVDRRPVGWHGTVRRWRRKRGWRECMTEPVRFRERREGIGRNCVNQCVDRGTYKKGNRQQCQGRLAHGTKPRRSRCRRLQLPVSGFRWIVRTLLAAREIR